VKPKPNPVGLISGPYSEEVSPWLDNELKRLTGLRIDARDVVRIFDLHNLSITCAINEGTIAFCLMRGDIDHSQTMIAGLKLQRTAADLMGLLAMKA
jgi:hypothetical protein